MTTIKQALGFGYVQLEGLESSQRDTQLLLMHVLQVSRSFLFTHPEKILTEQQLKEFERLIFNRKKNQPIAYLIGKKEFWSVELMVSSATLIPRPETELLVEKVLEQFATDEIYVADLGTGSGAIAIALAIERPQWIIHATDQDEEAVRVAKKNAAKYRIQNINFFLGDWFAGLPRQRYHIIISNPPYIRENDPHLSDLKYEPLSALLAGKEGLDALRIIIRQAKEYLKNPGWLFLEHGYDQSCKVQELLLEAQFEEIHVYKDLQGHDRVTCAKWMKHS